jgi:MFS family permease
VNAGRRNLIVLCLSNFVASTGMAGFLPAFPIILPRLGVTDGAASGSVALWSGVLVGAAPFAAALSGPLWGAFGDRYGRKAMVLRALGGLVLFVGIMSFVKNLWVLLILRLAQGCFSGFIAPSLTLASVHSPADRQGQVAALLQAALLAGGVAGPPIGGLILDHHDPSWLFTVASIAALVSFILVAVFAAEEVKPVASKPEGGAARAARAAVGDVLATLLDPGVLKLLAALFIIRCGVASVEPLFALYVRTFESRSEFIAQYLGFANGALVAATPLGNLLALPAWGRSGDLRGYNKALVLAAGGAGLFYIPQAFVPDPYSLFAMRFFAGMFIAGVVPAAYGMMAADTPIERRGSAFSLTFSAIALANSFAPVAGGWIVSTGLSVRPLLIMSGVPMILSAVWVARWKRPMQGHS